MNKLLRYIRSLPVLYSHSSFILVYFSFLLEEAWRLTSFPVVHGNHAARTTRLILLLIRLY